MSSAAEVVSQAAEVSFHPEMIAPAIEKWGPPPGPSFGWEHPCHFCDGTDRTVRWIFILDVLNHCFWPDPGEPVWTVAWGGREWSGYWGLAASLKRALEWGFPVTDPAWAAAVSRRDLERIFSGRGRIPLFEKRLENLAEAGAVILSELGGDVASLVRAASGSAVRLVRDVVALFPSFRDEAAYRGRKVFFWKRAQIFAADLYNAFGGKGTGGFHDIGRLTAFADYKLPQVLRELGIIGYGPELSARIDRLDALEPGSAPGVEIRAMTVHAVEEIRKSFNRLDRSGRTGGEVTSPEVDGWLWSLGQKDEFRTRPYHRCRTIFY